MSIEKDWETITMLALDPDHTSCFGRCIVDLHDRLAAVRTAWDDFSGIVAELSLRLDAVESACNKMQYGTDHPPSKTELHPDPSEWVGDICRMWGDWDLDDPNFADYGHLGVLVGFGEIKEFPYSSEYGIDWMHCRPATDEERIRYKGKPPTVNGELCLVRDNQEPEDWCTEPWRFIGTHPVSGAFIMCPVGGNENWSAPWKYARKLTPKELKQHKAGEESK